MAGRIAGITIEIGGDTTNLQKSLKSVDSQLKTTQNNLKDINKLLKLDPSNTELLAQKQKNLESAISGTKTRLEELKNAQAGVKEGSEEWDRLQREIIATEQDLKGLEKEYREFGSVSAQQIKAAGQSLQDYGNKVENVGKKFSVLSGAAAGALTAMGGLAYKTVQNADELMTLSQQTGLSTDEIQRMQYASELVDVSLSDMTGAVTKLKKQMAGSGTTFAELGVEVKNADGSMRDATDVFYDTLEALSQIENETERDQKAMEIFGKSADSLAGIIDDGGAALKEYGDEAESMGLILSEDMLGNLNEINDTIDKTKATAGASLAQLGATLAQTLAPILDKVVGLINRISEKLAALTPEQTETIMKILGIVAAIGPVLTIGGKLISMIGTITTAIGAVVGVLGGPLTLIIGAVIAVGVLLYKNWDTIKEKAIEMKNAVVATWENLKTTINGIIENVKGKIDSFKEKFEELKNKVSSIIETIKEKFSFKWELPQLKLPHINISYREAGGLAQFFGISQIPHLSVDWYKKAYENAVMFNSPTVLATPNGYKGFGDGHGAEIVMGLDKLRELVGAQQGVTINVYASAGMDINELANQIQRRFVAMGNQRRLAGA
mgnify:CR=1 FL=1